jgi:transcriptional regulator with XRE-family HTH domain
MVFFIFIFALQLSSAAFPMTEPATSFGFPDYLSVRFSYWRITSSPMDVCQVDSPNNKIRHSPKGYVMTERELRGILSANIKRYRTSRDLSQAALAEKLDISVNFLCNIENGNKWISPQTLVKFASALNIEPYELFKQEEALPPDASTLLNKYADEAVIAVTRTLNEIRGYYLPKTEAPAQD